MPGRVDGKVALVTGAAAGQGAAHARLLAREGASLPVMLEQRSGSIINISSNMGIAAIPEYGDESNQPIIDATPLRRGAQPEEISPGVLFLASDESRFVTGSELIMDGGYLAQ